MVQEVETRWEGIDILINNAGISNPLPVALMNEEDWNKILDINLTGQFLVAHAVLRGMIKRRCGHILNIGSLAGSKLIEAPVHYSASKSALNGFTRSLSKEVSSYNIKVNCLAPGLLDGGVARNLPRHRLDDFLKHLSLHRCGTLDEIADCAAFLVSDLNSFMNGVSLLADGGF